MLSGVKISLALYILVAFVSFGNVYSIDWQQGKQVWAMGCDFVGNDLTNAKTSGEQCGDTCDQNPQCTHFSWTNYNDGTCWLKSGPVSKSDAIESNDKSIVCGFANRDPKPSSMFLGTCYDAMHNREYPLNGGSVDSAALTRAIDKDFSLISNYFKYVRTFYSSFYSIPVAPYAAKYGIKLYIGVYMTDQSWYRDQVNAAVDAFKKYPGTVQAILVGNENLKPNGPYSANDIIVKMNELRDLTGRSVPVGTVQRITEWVNPQLSSETRRLADASDIIGVNIYPFFGSYDYNNPSQPLDQQWKKMIDQYGSAKLRLTETGFPSSGGKSPSGVNADLNTQISYFNAVANWKPSHGQGPAFWFAFYDRRPDDNTVPGEFEKHFGLFNYDRTKKSNNNFPPKL
jgi:exo-beta-1,3-glucanase (GH17 family)